MSDFMIWLYLHYIKCTSLHYPGARKASDPCFRYGTGNSGGISAEYLSALLPCRQVPQPNLRRCRSWSCAGMGDCSPSRRLCPGCRKLRQRNHHRCRAATLRQSCSRSQKRNALVRASIRDLEALLQAYRDGILVEKI